MYVNSKGSGKPVHLFDLVRNFTHKSGRSRGNFNQITRHMALLRVLVCALED